MNNLDEPHNFKLPSSSSSPLPITTLPSTNYDNYVYPHHERKKRTNLVKTNQPQMHLAILASNTSNKQKNNNIDRKKKKDPSEPKITRPCSECGKKFWSWKALFGHMRCHPERQWRGINPPPNFRCPTNGNTSLVNPPRDQQDYFLGTATTSATTISSMTEEEHEVAASLLMLANGDINVGSCDHHEEVCRFECSSCKKVFGSHQALGGHRASHKNVKGCFAITRSGDCCENPREDGDSGVDVKEKLEGVDNKMLGLEHKCGICLRVFSSGQALGGHKRCHWEKAEMDGSFSVVKQLEGPNYPLDLNLPAPVEDDLQSHYPSSLTNLDLRLGL